MDYPVDFALIDTIIFNLKKGRADAINHLTAKHLQFSHPAIITVLVKLLNIKLVNGIVPDSFCTSYTVPIPKCDIVGKSLSDNDFRGISIFPVIFFRIASLIATVHS